MSSDTDQSAATPPVVQADPPGPVDASAATVEEGAPGIPVTPIGRMLGWLRREPVLVVSLVYALVSIMGMWSNYWFYAQLGVPILDYLQGPDLFIIGLRRPDYFLVVLAVLVVVAAWGMPLYWALNNPERAAALFARRPWARWLLFTPGTPRSWHRGLFSGQNQILLFSLLLSLQYLYVWNVWNASRVVKGTGGGHFVQLTLAGASVPLPGRARLLGTTSAYVFVWWPGSGRVEVLPVANLARIESMHAVRHSTVDGARPGPAPAAPAPAPAEDEAAAATVPARKDHAAPRPAQAPEPVASP